MIVVLFIFIHIYSFIISSETGSVLAPLFQDCSPSPFHVKLDMQEHIG